MKRQQRVLLTLLVLQLCVAEELWAQPVTIAFGSCLRQWKPQPVWDGILTVEPQAFLFIGDNVYTDTGLYRFKAEPERIDKAYRELADVEGFQRLARKVHIYGTWDDHDYGRNNAGADYPYKEQSKAYFLDFFKVPSDAPEHQRPGIYASRYLDTEVGTIQIILLDTRTFRSPLIYGDTDAQCPNSRLIPNADLEATMLGESQWQWLASELSRPAALRLIVSSIQVIPDQHCFEKWANFPRQRHRLLELLGNIEEGRPVLLSGDRHLAEISRYDGGENGPLFEITASGMNSAGAGEGEANRYRVTPDNVRSDNFGVVLLDVDNGEQELVLQIRGVDGAVLQEVKLP
jgi:alkaline phosphatase D